MVRAVRPYYAADRIESHPRKPGNRGGSKRDKIPVSDAGEVEEKRFQSEHVAHEHQSRKRKESDNLPPTKKRVQIIEPEEEVEEAFEDGEDQDVAEDHSAAMEEESVAEDDSEEVFTSARTQHDADGKPKRVGSVLRSAKVTGESHKSPDNAGDLFNAYTR